MIKKLEWIKDNLSKKSKIDLMSMKVNEIIERVNNLTIDHEDYFSGNYCCSLMKESIKKHAIVLIKEIGLVINHYVYQLKLKYCPFCGKEIRKHS